MKKIFIALLAVLFVLSACKKENDENRDAAPVADDGVIDALFSTSPTNQVYFSKGNLQYQAVSHTWRFAENQYDYKGESNASISDIYRWVL